MRLEWELEFWFGSQPQCINDDGSYLFVCGGEIKSIRLYRFFRRRTKGVGAYRETLNKQQLENVSIQTERAQIFRTNEKQKIFTSTLCFRLFFSRFDCQHVNSSVCRSLNGRSFMGRIHYPMNSEIQIAGTLVAWCCDTCRFPFALFNLCQH